MRGNKGKNLRKMQEAAWVANKGKHRTLETKRKISETRLARKREAGVAFCETLGRPLFLNSGRWYVFYEGKKVSRAKALYEKEHGRLPNGWIVHHIDGNQLNDVLDNLLAMSRREHYLLHIYWKIINDWTQTNVSGEKILGWYSKWRTKCEA